MRDTKDYGNQSLKSRNLAWLVATLILDCIVILLLAFHTEVEDMTPSRLAVIRGSLTSLLPIPALIISSLITANIKSVLVFWRIKYPLPGSRAFSVHAQTDHRIDLVKLRKHVGEFPVDQREQNAKWYSLYKQIDSDPLIKYCHKNYLLFRDIAAMSLLLVLIVPAVMYFNDVTLSRILICGGLFLGQYLVVAFAARNTGVRLVQNVLALHASQKVGGKKFGKGRTS
jgi:hypothetical protein